MLGVLQAHLHRLVFRPGLRGRREVGAPGQQRTQPVVVMAADREEQRDAVAQLLVTGRARGRPGIDGHGELLLQPTARGETALLRGRHADAQELGDVRVGKPGEIVQRDDGTFVFRQ